MDKQMGSTKKSNNDIYDMKVEDIQKDFKEYYKNTNVNVEVKREKGVFMDLVYFNVSRK